MQRNLYLITSALILLEGCGATISTNSNNQRDQIHVKQDIVTYAKVNLSFDSIHPSNLLTVSDAEKILGEQSHLVDSSSTFEGRVAMYHCSFMADSKDEKSGKTGAIYFLSEYYSEVSTAKKKYSFIFNANKNNEGIKVLNGIGDEAYFHSDGQNFYFVMVRKETKVFNMKVNKITSKTSLDEFNLIANKITASL